MRNRICKLQVLTITIALVVVLFSSSQSQVGSLDTEALAQAQRFFNKMSIKCGNHYYYAYREQIAVMYQCKYPPTISVDGRTNQPRRLSEADKLNGVDPLPIAWQGRAIINLGLCRRQVPGPHGPGADAWEQWLDRNSDAVGLMNRKGQWEFANQPTGRELYTVKTVLPITCNDVPDPSRKSAPTPPSWRGRHYDGGQILRLPATYDRWFFLGRGPLTLKLTSTYSQIAIDGTNNSRTPSGEAMYLGAQTTDPNALAPNLKLGAVIVRIGTAGEAISPFESGSPVNDGYRIRSNEKIFIAINDSYYSDNRGAHVVIVEGGDLNLNAEDNKPAEPVRDEGTPSRVVLIGTQKGRALFDLSFWESAGGAGSKQTKGSRFPQSEARFITWRLFTAWDQPIESPLMNDLKAVWFKINDDHTLRRYDWSEQTGGRVIKMTKNAAEYNNGKGWSEPGRWEKGRWKVKIYQNDILVIDGEFEIY